MIQNVFMAKQKKNQNRDRHKPGRMTRVPESLAQQLDIAAELDVSNFTQQVTRAVREYLERRSLWPKPRS